MVKIRFASNKDAPLIARLSRKTFYETFAEFNTSSNMEKFMQEMFSQDLLEKEVGIPGNIFLLAYRNGKLAGYVKLKENSPLPGDVRNNVMEIARFYALKEMIGKGVGSAMMRACVNLARDAKKRMLWLGVWELNNRAIEFYNKWGFEKTSTHVFILGEDKQTDWIMKKEL